MSRAAACGESLSRSCWRLSRNEPTCTHGPACRARHRPRRPRRRGRGPAASARPRAVLRQPGDCGRPDLAGRAVHLLPQAVQGHAEYLGQEDGRSVRHGAPHHDRHQASDHRVLLDPRRQVHPLRPGPGRRRELQRLRRRSRGDAGRGQEVPTARNLTDAKGARAFIYSVPEERSRHHVRRPQRPRHGLARPLQGHASRPASETLLRKNTERIAGWVFDHAGTLRLAVRTTDNGDTEILRVDPDRLHEGLFVQRVRDAADPIDSTRTASGLHADEQGRSGPARGSCCSIPRRARRSWSSRIPLKRVDFGNAIFSRGQRRAGRHDLRGRAHARLLEGQGLGGGLQAAARASCPGKDVTFGSSTRDDRLWMIVASSDTEPGERYLFDRNDQEADAAVQGPREAAARSARADEGDPLQVVRRPARSRRSSRLPKGARGEEPAARSWCRTAARGRATPGATTATHSFWRTAATRCCSPTSAARPATARSSSTPATSSGATRCRTTSPGASSIWWPQGIADPKRVGIMGGSYGGYATLAGVAFTPDVYAAGRVDRRSVEPDHAARLDSAVLGSRPESCSTSGWEIRRPPDGKAQLERQSPLNSAAKIKTPLLVVQGANDPRVNKAESEQIVIALRDRGFPVEYLLAPDEGHGFARPVNNMALFAAAEKFLAKHLGGRYQEDVTPEVDEAPGRAHGRSEDGGAGEEGREAQRRRAEARRGPGGGQRPAYKATLEAGGQTIPMAMTQHDQGRGRQVGRHRDRARCRWASGRR